MIISLVKKFEKIIFHEIQGDLSSEKTIVVEELPYFFNATSRFFSEFFYNTGIF